MLPHLQRLNVLLSELRRRHVFRAVAVYAVVTWAVVEVASTVLPVFPIADPDTLVRGLVVLVVLGFPVVLVLAWAFDLTSQGVQRTGENETAAPPVLTFLRSGPFKASLLFFVIGLTGAVGWLSWQFWLHPGAGGGTAELETSLDPSRLAVLYFDDFSQGGELGYLANGITEALIHELSQVEALEVISRNGVKPYRDLTIPLDSLARMLGVGSIVEGSVEGSGDKIAVTVQLIEGESEVHLLSERIEARGEDVLALRDSIVQIAVRSLGQTLGRELQQRQVRTTSTNPEAWALYQEAQHLREDADTLRWALGDTLSAARTLRQADSLLAQAAALDPDWVEPVVARGWVARTRAGILSSTQTSRNKELLESGLGFAEEALDRTPGEAGALELRGTLQVDLLKRAGATQGDELARLAEEDLRRAIGADPGRVLAHIYLAELLRIGGAFQDASIAAQHALDADPFLINAEKEILFTLGQIWLDLGEIERASLWYDEGRRRYPAEPGFPATKLVILAGWGGAAGAVDTARVLVDRVAEGLVRKDWPLGDLLLAAVLAQHGMADSAMTLVEEVRSSGAGGGWRPYYEAIVRVKLGQDQEALDLLAEFLEAFPQRKGYIAHDWWWEPLREHPRFQRLVEEEDGS